LILLKYTVKSKSGKVLGKRVAKNKKDSSDVTVMIKGIKRTGKKVHTKSGYTYIKLK